jgi:dTDP-4-dehydrorhamnose 3,5-epimerase
MQVSQLEVSGVWRFTPEVHSDNRGSFLETFKASDIEVATGHHFDLQQMNLSISRAGVVRGIHFADVPPGQAKYVQCFAGRVLDVVVDIRTGSPTFGKWISVELSAENRVGLYLSEGLGHGFCALTDGATVGYLCSQSYAPEREHGLHPFDPTLAIDWPRTSLDLLSTKDASAPTLADALKHGDLPSYVDCQRSVARMQATIQQGSSSKE